MYCRFPKEFLLSVVEDSELNFEFITLDDSIRMDKEKNNNITYEKKAPLDESLNEEDDIWDEVDEEYSVESIEEDNLKLN